MNKEQILQLTGLSEDDFYDQYPDQESFCQDYPDMCPEMIYDDSLYEAQDGVETTAPYTDYNQYKNAMQTHFNEVAKANLYNSFQNDLYAYANKKPGFFETNTELQELFNSLSPKQQDALAQKYNAEFITNTPSANRKNYINSMEMNIPGKGMGYYSFPTNDVVYGRKVLERPNYEFPKLTMTPYQSEDDNKPIQILNNLVNLYKNPSFLNSKNGKSPIEKYSLNKTVEKVGAANKYISKPIVSPSTNYTSIVDLLKSRGEDSSFESRKKLAEEAGIKNYIGTASQNTKLLNSFNNNEMKHGGIHINPANKGKFTSWAQAHGMGVQQAAGLIQYQKGGSYTVKPNDTLGAIAAANKISLPELLLMNPQFKSNPNLIHVGDRVMVETPMQRSNREYGAIADAAMNRQKMMKYQVTPTDARSVTNGVYRNTAVIPVKTNIVAKSTPKSLPGKKEAKQEKNNLNSKDPRFLESGMIEDKHKNVMYVIKNGEVIKIMPIITGLNKDGEINDKGLAYMESLEKTNPKEAAKLRATPRGSYLSVFNPDRYGHPGFNMISIPAFGQPAPQATNISQHIIYGLGPKGSDGYDPKEGARRLKIMKGPGEQRVGSYGCTNMYGEDIDCLTGELFPKGDTTIVVDTRRADDAALINNLKYSKQFSNSKRYEKGGDIFPAMRTNFKHGGYYGMDGKFHPNSDSGTYVGGAGYYFQPGGTTVTPSTPPGAGGNPIDITTPNSFAYSNPNVPDANGFYPDGSFRVDQNENYNFDNQNEIDPYMTGDPVPGLEKDDDDDKFNNTFDDSQYSNQIDPNTGFTTWSKNNKVIRNIKKEDPALWGHLKEEGHGARWATGQTDFQRVGRTVGKIGQGLESAINVAGAIGGYLSNRQKQQNLDKSAMNKGSTASMFTNPEGSSKGDYGVTGSAYGMFKPNQMGNYSFKGMYGKYGMEVPRYDIGGGFSNLFGNAQTAAPISNPMELAPNISIQTPLIVSPTDNTRVATQRINSTRNDIPSGIIDVDLALQAVAGIESSSKPGETKVGMRTKLVGKTGKKATASGTYQITEPTLKDIYNNNSNFNKTFKNFNEFKLAFDSNPEVEYAAAKSLMSNHIKNYGIYALGAWYQPSFAKRAMKGDKSVYDIIPSKDEYGNKKTWGQDFKEKLNAYNKIAGTSYNINSSISTKSPSVNIKNLHPNLMQFTNVISQTFPGLVLTSGNDSKHMKGSKHYNNKAIDIGANTSNKKDYLNLKNYLKNNPSIKKQYGIEDIIDEGDHLHIELMKKGGQFGGQVVEMDENEIQQFLKAGGQLEFID